MSDTKYEVFVDGHLEATNLDLEIALTFIKALFHEYYQEHGMQICIQEMSRSVTNES